MMITDSFNVLAFSADGQSALMKRTSHGPEGGGELAYYLIDINTQDVQAFVVSSDYSPGDGSRPQQVSNNEFNKKTSTLLRELKQRRFPELTLASADDLLYSERELIISKSNVYYLSVLIKDDDGNIEADKPIVDAVIKDYKELDNNSNVDRASVFCDQTKNHCIVIWVQGRYQNDLIGFILQRDKTEKIYKKLELSLPRIF